MYIFNPFVNLQKHQIFKIDILNVYFEFIACI